jgi:hypothetical protein
MPYSQFFTSAKRSFLPMTLGTSSRLNYLTISVILCIMQMFSLGGRGWEGGGLACDVCEELNEPNIHSGVTSYLSRALAGAVRPRVQPNSSHVGSVLHRAAPR